MLLSKQHENLIANKVKIELILNLLNLMTRLRLNEF